jgi:hypothetical protein
VAQVFTDGVTRGNTPFRRVLNLGYIPPFNLLQVTDLQNHKVTVYKRLYQQGHQKAKYFPD